jgi:hypothetical protein
VEGEGKGMGFRLKPKILAKSLYHSQLSFDSGTIHLPSYALYSLSPGSYSCLIGMLADMNSLNFCKIIS